MPYKMTGSILIVDDTPANIELLSRLLHNAGHRLRTAASGQAALDEALTDPPDLILLDIAMPGMNGFQVCECLKADERTRHIPIIFISSSGDIEAIVRAFEVGGVDYITKPFNTREVLARVSSHLMMVKQRQEIEALHEQDRQQFEAIHRMKNEFIGTATHDLKNPLFLILGYVSLMESEETIATHPLGIQIIEGIRQGVEKMSNLVADMLDLMQLETGRQLERCSVLLSEFLQESIKGFDMLAAQKDITLSLLLPRQDVLLSIDAKWMRRVMDNLISNAIKYTLPGGQIEVSGQVNSHYALLNVADTGLGIPEDALSHLFETFYRVNSPQHMEQAGTGLGLSIVRAIVEQHGGTIQVESEPGKGSLFSVALPISVR